MHLTEEARLKSYDVRSMRLKSRLAQRDLATRAGVSLHQLSQCERGLILPNEEFFVAIANAMGVEPSRLQRAQQDLIKVSAHGEGYFTSRAGEEFLISPITQPNQKKVPIFDLFCGTGGFSHGFERTGKFEVTLGVDLLKDRIMTFTANHPAASAWCKDAHDLKLEELSSSSPAPRVIIGGPPCQGFSSIRPFRTLTKGDRRNNLYEQFVLSVEWFRPDWFVMENVVGLLTHNDGETLNHIVNLFGEIGYHTDWKILNAAFYGLPQRRERLLIVGNRSGRNFEWPQPTHFYQSRSMAGQRGQIPSQFSMFDAALPNSVSVMDAISDLPPIASGQSANCYYDNINLTPYQESMRGQENILTLHEATRHSPHMLEIIRHAGSSKAALPPGLVTSGFSTCYSRLEANEPSVTLTVNFVHPASNKCIHPFQDRALTPREGARLQGFEDSFIFKGTRAQIVKQIGNAVPPLLGYTLAKSILEQW
jgi:DNA (cytosine-5)-methyltransferase 1